MQPQAPQIPKYRKRFLPTRPGHGSVVRADQTMDVIMVALLVALRNPSKEPVVNLKDEMNPKMV